MNAIYTYHDYSPEINNWYDGKGMLDLWRSAWATIGWTPIVLSRAHAEQHPDWQRFSEAINRLPTINPKSYENACFHRWAAMAVLPHGGIMCDADVIPNGPIPENSFAHHGSLTIWSQDCREAFQPCPCLVSGTRENYDLAVRHFMGFRANQAHLSDQEILRQRGIPFVVENKVMTYGDSQVLEALAVHFKTDAIGLGAKTKPARIRDLLTSMESATLDDDPIQILKRP